MTETPSPAPLGHDLGGSEDSVDGSEAAHRRCIDHMYTGRPSRVRLPGPSVGVEAYPRAKPFLTPFAAQLPIPSVDNHRVWNAIDPDVDAPVFPSSPHILLSKGNAPDPRRALWCPCVVNFFFGQGTGGGGAAAPRPSSPTIPPSLPLHESLGASEGGDDVKHQTL